MTNTSSNRFYAVRMLNQNFFPFSLIISPLILSNTFMSNMDYLLSLTSYWKIYYSSVHYLHEIKLFEVLSTAAGLDVSSHIYYCTTTIKIINFPSAERLLKDLVYASHLFQQMKLNCSKNWSFSGFLNTRSFILLHSKTSILSLRRLLTTQRKSARLRKVLVAYSKNEALNKLSFSLARSSEFQPYQIPLM